MKEPVSLHNFYIGEDGWGAMDYEDAGIYNDDDHDDLALDIPENDINHGILFITLIYIIMNN